MLHKVQIPSKFNVDQTILFLFTDGRADAGKEAMILFYLWPTVDGLRPILIDV